MEQKKRPAEEVTKGESQPEGALLTDGNVCDNVKARATWLQTASLLQAREDRLFALFHQLVLFQRPTLAL
ncbi:MAG: hypothetical protein J6Y84_00160 [Bacteroidaceae bacterium]|nr:hypothetical protein [Bacteroidaceae bacterium]